MRPGMSLRYTHDEIPFSRRDEPEKREVGGAGLMRIFITFGPHGKNACEWRSLLCLLFVRSKLHKRAKGSTMPVGDDGTRRWGLHEHREIIPDKINKTF